MILYSNIICHEILSGCRIHTIFYPIGIVVKWRSVISLTIHLPPMYAFMVTLPNHWFVRLMFPVLVIHCVVVGCSVSLWEKWTVFIFRVSNLQSSSPIPDHGGRDTCITLNIVTQTNRLTMTKCYYQKWKHDQALYCSEFAGFSIHDGTLLHSKSQYTTIKHSRQLLEHTYTSDPHGLGTLTPIEFFQQDLL
jgi:hypothetical protein